MQVLQLRIQQIRVLGMKRRTSKTDEKAILESKLPRTLVNPRKKTLMELWYLRYTIILNVYMLTYWEAVAFNTVFIVGVGLTIYSTFTYLPFWFSTVIDNVVQLAN